MNAADRLLWSRGHWRCVLDGNTLRIFRDTLEVDAQPTRTSDEVRAHSTIWLHAVTSVLPPDAPS